MTPACLANLPFGSLSCGNILTADEVKPILTLGSSHVPFFSLEWSSSAVSSSHSSIII